MDADFVFPNQRRGVQLGLRSCASFFLFYLINFSIYFGNVLQVKGGFRAVVWADTFQMILMLLGIIIIIIVGVHSLGGVVKIWAVNEDGGRLQLFDFDLNPRLRQSFWTFAVGSTFNQLAYLSTSQFVVQRCVSLPTLSKAKVAVIINSIILVKTILLSSFTGLMLYAAFHGCDPISAKKISKPDQLLPYFIMSLKDRIPTIPSIIISIVFCSALSSVSSGLNSISGVILIDFICPFFKKPITDAQGSFYMKIIAVVIGVLYTGVTFTLNNPNSLVQSTVSLNSIILGSCLGIFTLGVLFPLANSNGAFVGGIAGGALVAWISIGAQIAKRVHSRLPLSIENCGNDTVINFVNRTSGMGSSTEIAEPFYLYSISFYYYSVIGTFTSIIVGMIVSYFTGFNEPKDTDPRLFSPMIRKYLKRDETASEMTSKL